ncbi:hypothetical protein C8F01DRAFT_1284711 [Mycena amicta]|nr:hypothetical protein C8F01DRAFT_1284711 [Mycena amicta]
MDEPTGPGFSFEATAHGEHSVQAAQQDRFDNTRASYTGAFFPRAHDLVITGGSFTSITNISHPEPTIPPDFRMISLGDLDLRREIRLESTSGMVHRSRVVSVRRVYSARIHGYRTPMTVAMYQGRNSEKEWGHNIMQHSHFRHPNLVQLFGTVKSPGLHAAIYIDELIPAPQVVWEAVSKGPMFPTYLWACMDVDEYLQAVSGTNLDSEIVASMSLSGYHEICREWQATVILTFGHKNVTVGTIHQVTQHGTGIGDYPEIASCNVGDLKYEEWHTARQLEGFKMVSGWTRVENVASWPITSRCSSSQASQNWLTQANYVFDRLKIESTFEDYAMIEMVCYILDKDPGFEREIPPGYLFLCPVTDLQSDKPGQSQSLDDAAYWSLDPMGANRMSAEEAEAAGFPRLCCTVAVEVCNWDDTVYIGLRTFHTGKGFDPSSQDLARHLGYQLYEVSSIIDSDNLFAHGVEETDAADQNEEVFMSD